MRLLEMRSIIIHTQGHDLFLLLFSEVLKAKGSNKFFQLNPFNYYVGI